MNKQIEISNTYYVLDNISTCPIAVQLADYSRKRAEVKPEEGNFNDIAKKIQATWSYIEQEKGQDNERIRLFLNPEGEGRWKDTVICPS